MHALAGPERVPPTSIDDASLQPPTGGDRQTVVHAGWGMVGKTRGGALPRLEGRAKAQATSNLSELKGHALLQLF